MEPTGLLEVTPLLANSRKASTFSTLSFIPDMLLLTGGNIDEITLTWHNINAHVPAMKGKCCSKTPPHLQQPKQILKNVNGIIKPGELVAVMGSSGSGKTTLMNVLMSRNQGNLIIDGDIRINGKALGPAVSSLSAYVQQHDLFIGTLKVREHLIFQAMLRMNKNLPYHQRIKRVDEVILELGLMKCKDTLIGIPGRVKCISGGEMKRLSFACEVLTDPPLLFCDEPTSGLDSFMAESVVTLLKDMAENGKTILCTIHQPSSETFAMFDHLLLMADGRLTFLGPTRKVQPFFASLGYVVPPNFNPADYYVYILAVAPGKEDECKQRIENIHSSFFQSKRGQTILDYLDKVTIDEDPSQLQEAFAKISPYKATWFQQFRALMWRSWLTVIREPMIFKIRLLHATLLALILGVIYLRQELTQEGVMNINGALFMFLTNLSLSNLSGVIHTFASELTIFLREHKNGMYRVDTYFLSKTIADMPCYFTIPAVFVSISYWLIGLYNDFITFLLTATILILVSNCAVSFGYMISCISGSTTIAISLSSPLVLPLLLFGGFFLNSASVPVYFIWLQYISWFKYGNEALLINQWRNVGEIDCKNNTLCPKTGSEVLESLNFHEKYFTQDLILLAVLLVVFRLIAFVALLVRSYKK